MSQLSNHDIQNLAQLSALTVGDQEAEQLKSELANIIAYVDQLQAVDTSQVEPTYQVSYQGGARRTDELVDYGVSPDELLAGAPDSQDGQIKVPRVIK